MSGPGQSRHFGRWPTTSGLPLETDIAKGGRHVSKVPKPELTFAIRVPLQSVRNEAAAQIISRRHRYKKATTWVAFLFYF